MTSGSASLYTVNLGTGVKARCKTGSQSADDDAGPNCRFYKMHSSEGGIVYKTTNPFSEFDDAGSQRTIYFFSDIPLILKTSRNCLSHPSGDKMTRHMWVSFLPVYCCWQWHLLVCILLDYIHADDKMDTAWSHLLGTFEDSTYPSQSLQGLSLIPKLSREHFYLTGYSRMRVDLAALVHIPTLAVIQE